MFSLAIIYAILDCGRYKRKMLQTIIKIERLLWKKLYDDVIVDWYQFDGGNSNIVGPKLQNCLPKNNMLSRREKLKSDNEWRFTKRDKIVPSKSAFDIKNW